MLKDIMETERWKVLGFRNRNSKQRASPETVIEVIHAFEASQENRRKSLQ